MSNNWFELPGLGLPLRTIYGIGRNFREHAAELNNPVPSEPVVFLKPGSSACGEGTDIVIPPQSTRVDPEVEIVVGIGRRGKNIPADRALDYVAGYAVGIDFTARDLQDVAKKKSLPWAVAKGFDTFAPMSRFVPAREIPDVSALSISLEVNGELRQKGSASEMLFSIPELIAYLSGVFTLMPGDVIFTGTPAGVRPVQPGDRLSAVLGASDDVSGSMARLELRVKS